MLPETKKNILKLQTKDDAIAENLDNTVPFKSIITAIEQKKKKGKTLLNYINNTVRRKQSRLEVIWFSHFLYPSQPRNTFSEEWDGGLKSGFFEEFPVKSLMPWMISKVRNCGIPDPAMAIMKERHDWIHKWEIFKFSYRMASHRRHKWCDDDVLYCPKIFVDMAEHLEKIPDPYFDDTYNWYYAGKGNLSLTSLDGSDYLIHSEFNCLYVSPFFKDNLSIDYANSISYTCAEGANIMETIHSLNIIVLRTKRKVIILKIVTNEKVLMLERLKEMDSELPFTSITFDEFHKNILYVTTLDYQLTIVNLDRMAGRSKKLRGKFDALANNWSSVIGAERSCFAHITKKAITLYDKRNNEPYQRWKNFKFVSDHQGCTEISVAKYCPQQPFMYVATNHHLFLMDMRCGKTKEDNMKPVQRWTHGMMSSPTYMDICNIDHNNSKEMLCLSSQWFEDMCLVSNYSDRLTRVGEINGMALPYRPPSIMQTYNEAQRKRLCFSVDSSIHCRLCTSITGVSIVNQDDNHSVLMQNALGDVSCHAVYPEHMHSFIEDDSSERLHEWSRNYKEEKKPFEVTHLIDIQNLLKNLSLIPDDFILGRNYVIKPRLKFNEREIYETYKNEQLDPELLEIWKEIDNEAVLEKTGADQFFVDT